MRNAWKVIAVLGVVLSGVGATAADLDDGLVAFYPFNGSAADATGNGYDGTLVGGVALTQDRFGVPASAFEFDGTSGYIDLGTALDVPSWSSYSISVWLLNDGGGDWSNGYGQKVIDKTVPFSDFYLSVDDAWGHKLTFRTYEDESHRAEISDVCRDYRNSPWHHAVMIKDGSHGELWIDGERIGTSEVMATVHSSARLLLGYSLSADFFQRKHWSGKIDDVRVYDRPLSATEVQELYLPGDRPLISSTQCGTRVTIDPGHEVVFTAEVKDRAGTTVTIDATGIPERAKICRPLPAMGNPILCRFVWRALDIDANTEHPVVLTATTDSVNYATCEFTIEVRDPLLVTLESFTARPGDGQVTLGWVTLAEIDNAGFYLLRTDVATGETIRLVSGLIPAMGDVFVGAQYSFVDDIAVNGTEYEYVLVDVEMSGKETRHPAVRATPNPTDPVGRRRGSRTKRPTLIRSHQR